MENPIHTHKTDANHLRFTLLFRFCFSYLEIWYETSIKIIIATTDKIRLVTKKFHGIHFPRNAKLKNTKSTNWEKNGKIVGHETIWGNWNDYRLATKKTVKSSLFLSFCSCNTNHIAIKLFLKWLKLINLNCILKI